MFYIDPMYLLFMIPGFLLMTFAQLYVNSAYKKWSQVPSYTRLTGAQAAQRLIQVGGLYGVQVSGIGGKLTDHYDPRTKELRLSPGVYQGNSVAALAIAAHELGHAQQDQEGYLPMRVRSALVPAVNIGSYLGWGLIFIGLLIRMSSVAWLGVLVFSLGAVFALATLPVELNASSRARKMLLDAGMLTGSDEERGVSNVLNAAALTYVAALVTAVMQLLYWATLVMGMGGRRRS